MRIKEKDLKILLTKFSAREILQLHIKSRITLNDKQIDKLIKIKNLENNEIIVEKSKVLQKGLKICK